MKKNCPCLMMVVLLLVLSSNAAKAQVTKTETDTIVSLPANTKVEVVPSFRGGVDGWRRYLEGNLKYPSKALKKNIQGLVRVQMKVDAKGKVTEVKALNDPGGGLAKEAERVIKEGPNWLPAERNGEKVAYQFVQSITFQLE